MGEAFIIHPVSSAPPLASQQRGEMGEIFYKHMNNTVGDVMTLRVPPPNSGINCQHLPCSTSSAPCSPSFSQCNGPDPAALTLGCELSALLGSRVQVTLQKGQWCWMRCPVPIPRSMSNSIRTWFLDTYLSLIWLP